MNATETRKARGMLLDRSSTLDREIADLFATDPGGDDLVLATREKAETRKALATVDAIATDELDFARIAAEHRRCHAPTELAILRDDVAARLASNPFLTGDDEIDLPVIHTMTLLAMLGLTTFAFNEAGTNPCERSLLSKRYNAITAELRRRGVNRQ